MITRLSFRGVGACPEHRQWCEDKDVLSIEMSRTGCAGRLARAGSAQVVADVVADKKHIKQTMCTCVH